MSMSRDVIFPMILPLRVTLASSPVVQAAKVIKSVVPSSNLTRSELPASSAAFRIIETLGGGRAAVEAVRLPDG